MTGAYINPAQVPGYAYLVADVVMGLLASPEFQQDVYELSECMFRQEFAHRIARGVSRRIPVGSSLTGVGVPECLTLPLKDARAITDRTAEELLRYTPAPVQRHYAHERGQGKTPKLALQSAARYLAELNKAAGHVGHD